jgi:hypothetical protein
MGLQEEKQERLFAFCFSHGLLDSLITPEFKDIPSTLLYRLHGLEIGVIRNELAEFLIHQIFNRPKKVTLNPSKFVRSLSKWRTNIPDWHLTDIESHLIHEEGYPWTHLEAAKEKNSQSYVRAQHAANILLHLTPQTVKGTTTRSTRSSLDYLDGLLARYILSTDTNSVSQHQNNVADLIRLYQSYLLGDVK